MNNKECIKFTWNEMDELHRKLCLIISNSDYHPEVIVGIMRCGMVSAIHMAYIMGIKDVGGIIIKTTQSDEIMAQKTKNPVLIDMMPQRFINQKNVLLVDTVMASGLSVKNVKLYLEQTGAKEVKVAIAVDWPKSPYSNLLEDRPLIHFIGDEVEIWPDFPWEH